MKHVITETDLITNPELVEQGIKVGDEIDIPDDTANLTDESNPQSLDGDDFPPPPEDPGGNNPPKKPIIP